NARPIYDEDVVSFTKHIRNRASSSYRFIVKLTAPDRLYTYFKTNKLISSLILIENEPMNAPWNERYFHLREPDGFQLSFAQPI
ncbi:MAG TPA: hypothetical protein VFT71_08780, partial [Candidatus Nitrosocosmicus sp.]|nr:hypothetical protein [Candidatus Nitrosocosmicus sp.]